MKRIIIAGSGRSGTTWVQDSLAVANNMKTLFEPLHPKGVKNASRFAYQYISKNENNDELKYFLDTVFSGELRSIWVNYRIRPDRFNILQYGLKDPYFYVKKFYRHYKKYSMEDDTGLIVKFIRANLMLPWIVSNYDIRTVLIIRHPCAVISSRFKLPDADWSAENAINRYRNNLDVVNLIMKEFDVDINTDMTAASAMACVWCIENLLPIKWARNTPYDVVAYESLLTDDGTEWSRLVQRMGLDNTPGTSLLESPSQQVSPEMRNKKFTTQLVDKWKEQLDEKAISEIAAILDQFGCDYYSVNSGIPLPGYRSAAVSK